MTQCGFKQRFFTKASLKVKVNGLMDRKLVTKNMAVLAIFYCFLCKSRKWEINIKNTTFYKSSFYAALDSLLFTTRFRYFRKYSWSYPQRGWRDLGLVSTQKGPPEKSMNKL